MHTIECLTHYASLTSITAWFKIMIEVGVTVNLENRYNAAIYPVGGCYEPIME